MTRDDWRAKADELMGRVARAESMGDHARASGYERELRRVWATLARLDSTQGQSTTDRPTGGTDGATATGDAPVAGGPESVRGEVDRLHGLADRAARDGNPLTAQHYARQAAALQGRAADAPANVTAGASSIIGPDTDRIDPTCKPTVADEAPAVRGGYFGATPNPTGPDGNTPNTALDVPESAESLPWSVAWTDRDGVGIQRRFRTAREARAYLRARNRHFRGMGLDGPHMLTVHRQSGDRVESFTTLHPTRADAVRAGYAAIEDRGACDAVWSDVEPDGDAGR